MTTWSPCRSCTTPARLGPRRPTRLAPALDERARGLPGGGAPLARAWPRRSSSAWSSSPSSCSGRSGCRSRSPPSSWCSCSRSPACSRPAEAFAGFANDTVIFIFALLAMTEGLAATGVMRIVAERLTFVAPLRPARVPRRDDGRRRGVLGVRLEHRHRSRRSCRSLIERGGAGRGAEPRRAAPDGVRVDARRHHPALRHLHEPRDDRGDGALRPRAARRDRARAGRAARSPCSGIALVALLAPRLLRARRRRRRPRTSCLGGTTSPSWRCRPARPTSAAPSRTWSRRSGRGRSASSARRDGPPAAEAERVAPEDRVVVEGGLDEIVAAADTRGVDVPAAEAARPAREEERRGASRSSWSSRRPSRPARGSPAAPLEEARLAQQLGVELLALHRRPDHPAASRACSSSAGLRARAVDPGAPALGGRRAPPARPRRARARARRRGLAARPHRRAARPAPARTGPPGARPLRRRPRPRLDGRAAAVGRRPRAGCSPWCSPGAWTGGARCAWSGASSSSSGRCSPSASRWSAAAPGRSSATRSRGVAALGGPRAVLVALALLTILLSAPMSNQAAALVVFPVALSAAARLGIDPRPLAIAVTLAGSCSFMTPLEPAAMLVYGAGPLPLQGLHARRDAAHARPRRRSSRSSSPPSGRSAAPLRGAPPPRRA